MSLFNIIFDRKSGDGSSGSMTVDTTISGTSENPVQNKVIKAALELKADKTKLPTIATGTFTKDSRVGSSTIIIKAQQIGNIVFISGGGVMENAFNTYTTQGTLTLGVLTGVTLPQQNPIVPIYTYTTSGQYTVDFLTFKSNGSVQYSNSTNTDTRFLIQGFYIV